jgi:hypothetical protein
LLLMTLPTPSDRDFDHAKLLLEEYAFDLSGFTAGELVAIWQERLEAEVSWIRSAVLEALYQGRYKAFSVEQILQAWKRRGYPVRHFTSEFERVVFGPIDPTISKYAAMTSLSPSEMMSPLTGTEAATPPAVTDGPSAEPEPHPDGVTPPVQPDEPHPATLPAPDESGAIAAGPPDAVIDEPPEPLQPSPPAASAEQLSLNAYLEPESSMTLETSVFSQPAPIRKFVPQSEASGFYMRLQSVAKKSQ